MHAAGVSEQLQGPGTRAHCTASKADGQEEAHTPCATCCTADHQAATSARRPCSHCSSGRRKRRWPPWQRMLFLASLMCQTQLAQAQIVACPCLPLPGMQGCNNSQILVLVSSGNGFPGTLQLCAPAPSFDSRWGALYISTCWNTSCLPPQLTGMLTTTMRSFTTVLPGLLPGRYSVLFAGPAGRLTSVAGGTSGTVSNNSLLLVPASGLTSMSVSWSTSTASTQNSAGLTLTYMELVGGSVPPITTPPPALPPSPPPSPPLPPGSTLADASCSDVVSLDGSLACSDGKVPVYVFDGVTSLLGLDLRATPNGTRCVAPPSYDPYNQQLSWNLTWNLACYANATKTPIVLALKPIPASNAFLWQYLTNRTVSLRMASAIQSYTLTDGTTPYLTPFLTVGPANASTGYTTSTTFDGSSLQLPASGVANLSLAVQLQGRAAIFSVSSAYFLLTVTDVVTSTARDIQALRDAYQTVDFTAQAVLPDQYTESRLAGLVTLMGLRSSAKVYGWRLSAPVLFRDYSLLWDCSAGAVESLLQTVATSVGLPRATLSATCTSLAPGQAFLVTAPPSPVVQTLSNSPPSAPPTPASLSPPPSLTGRRRQLSGWVGGELSTNRVPPAVQAGQQGLPGEVWALQEAGGSARRRLMGLGDSAGLCPDARLQVIIYHDSLLPVLNDANMTTQLADARTNVTAGVTYALSSVATSQTCTLVLATSTIVQLGGGVLTSRGNTAIEAVCVAALDNAVSNIKVFELGMATDVLLIGDQTCTTSSPACVDCWKYPIAVWAMVLMILAFCILLVAILMLRACLTKRTEVPRAGQLDVEGTTRALRVIQMNQLREQQAEGLEMKLMQEHAQR